jgi:hypothetical protein
VARERSAPYGLLVSTRSILRYVQDCCDRCRFSRKRKDVTHHYFSLSNSLQWDPQRAQWNMLFEKLQSFAKEHSHCKVPKGYTNDPELANWVRNQRLEYANLQRNKKTRMTADRVEKLNALGFKWSTAVPSRRTYADTKEGKKTQVQELSTAPKHPTSAQGSTCTRRRRRRRRCSQDGGRRWRRGVSHVGLSLSCSKCSICNVECMKMCVQGNGLAWSNTGQ